MLVQYCHSVNWWSLHTLNVLLARTIEGTYAGTDKEPPSRLTFAAQLGINLPTYQYDNSRYCFDIFARSSEVGDAES